MKHLRRAGALLATILIMTFIAPRFLPPVESLQVYGFYRGTSTQEWAVQPLQYKASTTCASCHQSKYEVWSKSGHKTVACESCHGPAKDHPANGAIPLADKSNQLCENCHLQLASRPADFPQVPADHVQGASCMSCHNPHRPGVQFPATISHDLKGKDNCLSCHKPDGSNAYPANHEQWSQAACLSCHKPE